MKVQPVSRIGKEYERRAAQPQPERTGTTSPQAEEGQYGALVGAGGEHGQRGLTLDLLV